MNTKLIKKSKLFNWQSDEELSKLINIFSNKVEICFVGGCVRDTLLGIDLKDIDFAINCTPNETIDILSKNKIKYNDYGADHGSVTVLINKKKYEITSLRKDISTYGRFAKVEYTNDWHEDAARRDFTINAIYLSVNGNIYDDFNGMKDIQNNNLSFIGSTAQRIQEDYLRILRFYRFLGIFNKPKYDQEDFIIIEDNLDKIKEFVSNDKIKIELSKMMKNKFFINSFTMQSNKKTSKKNILMQKLEKWWEEDKYNIGLELLGEFNNLVNVK